MSDTLLQTGGVFDARTIGNAVETWANANPGIPCRLTNSLAQAAKAGIWNSTLTLDIEFKERLPEEGLEWAFTRVVTRELRGTPKPRYATRNCGGYVWRDKPF